MAEKRKDEYSPISVSMSQRKGFLEICMFCICYVFVVTGMQVGGIMRTATDFKKLLIAMSVGSLLLLVLGSFMGLIALKTGLTFGLLCRDAFGKVGYQVILFLLQMY